MDFILGMLAGGAIGGGVAVMVCSVLMRRALEMQQTTHDRYVEDPRDRYRGL